MEKTSWKEALIILSEKLKSFSPDQIAGVVGDLVDLETICSFKSFFEKTLGSSNYESRNKKIYINPSERMNYIFN